MSDRDPILVLGIGNILWADEGFGVRVVETIASRHRFPDHVHLVDGGTQGMYLLRYVQATRRMVVVDAVDYGREPGTLEVVRGDAVPSFLGVRKLSLHQTGFQEVLAAARMLGQYPDEVVLVGVQPVEVEDFGGSLRDLTRSRVDPAIDLVLEVLATWGVEPFPSGASEPSTDLAPAGVALGRYESGRPSAEAACRIGDPRFMPASPER